MHPYLFYHRCCVALSLIPDVPYSVILNEVKDLLFEEWLIRCSKTENVEKS